MKNNLISAADYVDAPIGRIWIYASETAILAVSFVQKDYSFKSNELTGRAKQQLLEYFEGTRKTFDLPLEFIGTEFQKKVWLELNRIPYGEVETYKDVACKIDNSKAVRAVGGACNRNPFMIVVPCHRVVGSNQSLTGYACGLGVKKYLLDLEKR